jgi:hypothetical protein
LRGGLPGSSGICPQGSAFLSGIEGRSRNKQTPAFATFVFSDSWRNRIVYGSSAVPDMRMREILRRLIDNIIIFMEKEY